jgi:hypothetical protein
MLKAAIIGLTDEPVLMISKPPLQDHSIVWVIGKESR